MLHGQFRGDPQEVLYQSIALRSRSLFTRNEENLFDVKRQ